jgi:hypothetical protein
MVMLWRQPTTAMTTTNPEAVTTLSTIENSTKIDYIVPQREGKEVDTQFLPDPNDYIFATQGWVDLILVRAG